ncbi:MAG: methylmalonyl Co-A mutase-associated GTPase MeaB [Planctomycetota bacterium]|jgi:LAO/AO transport system kinase|nr:methylmalonyl Co-A mutase-associated GTPase MeaB [Planctomycetota bacterium]
MTTELDLVPAVSIRASSTVDIEDLIERFLAGDRLALAKALTRIERGGGESEQILERVHGRAGRAIRLGVTGPPGAGKSTVVSALIRQYREAGKTVGVVAVDPSSSFTGGALLGDRVRMQEFATDRGVFIRSMASRGRLGGLSGATLDATLLMDAFGLDIVFIETVGVGQSEIDVAEAVDTTLVVISPESGDGIQALKAGLMEVADLFVVNKCDREGADRLERELLLTQDILDDHSEKRQPEIVRTSAANGMGILELIEAIDRHQEFMQREGRLSRRRRENLARQLRAMLAERMERLFFGSSRMRSDFEEAVRLAEVREETLHRAVGRLVQNFLDRDSQDASS